MRSFASSIRHERVRSMLPGVAAVLVMSGYWLLASVVTLWGGSGTPDLAAALWPGSVELLTRLSGGGLLAGLVAYALSVRAGRRRSEERLDEVLETVSDAYLRLDHKWRIQAINTRAEALFGCASRDVLGRSFWDCFPEAASHLFKPLARTLNAGQAATLQSFCTAMDRFIEVTAVPKDKTLSLFIRDITRQQRFEKELAEKNQKLQAILDSAGESIITINGQGIVQTFNAAAEICFGYHADEVIGRNVSMLMPEPDASNHDRYIANYLHSGLARIIGFGSREVTGRRRDGSTFPMDLTVGEMRIENEPFFVGIVRDITERKRADEALRRSEASLAEAQRVAKLGSWTWDIRAGTLSWSDEVYRLLGVERTFDASYDSFLSLVHPGDRERVAETVRSALDPAGTGIYRCEHRIVRPDGVTRYLLERAETRFDRHGQPITMFGTVQDISEIKQAREAAEFSANFDQLTGLPNRTLMQYRLQQALYRARREKRLIAVCFLGLDRFKPINDTFGHAGGDQVLMTMATRLREGCREGDTVARLGADEFAVVLDGIADVDEVAHQGQRLLQAVARPIEINEERLVMSAALGITLFPHDGESVDTLFRNADIALHRAKQSGPGSYQFFTANMTTESQARMRLEQDLRRALEEEQFELFYQPQIDLATGRVIGLEALLRWRHPEHGLISPAAFIPVLEDTGLIVPVGHWVMEHAARQSRHWQMNGLPPMRIAVNLSALQFRQKDLVEQIDDVLARTGLAGQHLELEITEGLLVENVEETVATLNRLSERGIQISIDDFGTGYSSMSYLQRLPVHTLKLDRTFVQNLDSGDSVAIARAVIALAHSLRLRVIAEGVESREQLRVLALEACDEVQGFLFSKPLPAERMEAWLREQHEGAIRIDGLEQQAVSSGQR